MLPLRNRDSMIYLGQIAKPGPRLRASYRLLNDRGISYRFFLNASGPEPVLFSAPSMFLHFLRFILITLEVLVVFNLMIIVHELGHFLAAKWRGLVIEKFGIWFGKPLWKKTVDGIEYSFGSLPFGGFVALPQMAPMEVMEGKTETPREALPPVSALDKIIVAFAGPLFSFGLAVVFAT